MNSELIRDYFHNTSASRRNIIAFCNQQYRLQSKKKGHLLSPLRLDKLVRMVCSVLRKPKSEQNAILNSLYHVKLKYRIRSLEQVNIAPIFHPQQHLQLIKTMWSRPQKSALKQFNMQSAALQALICLHTGRRWVDSCRLRWELVKKVRIRNRIFIKIPLPMSKGNKGVRNEYVTFQNNDTSLCPVKLLHKFWYIQGTPSFGFIFPCTKSNLKVKKGLFEYWNARTCSGHGRNANKDIIECLGQTDSGKSFGFYQRAARAAKWSTLPHKHSFRRGAVVVAHALKLSRDRITEIFGWKHDSNMPSHYLANELATTKQSLAWNMADQLQSKTNFKCLKHVHFAS